MIQSPFLSLLPRLPRNCWLRCYLSFLRQNKVIDLRSLAWTLSRRSAFSFRTAISASSVGTLCRRLEEAFEDKTSAKSRAGTHPRIKDVESLAYSQVKGLVGRLWAGKFVLASPFVDAIIDQLENFLAELPEAGRPSWSLKKELLGS